MKRGYEMNIYTTDDWANDRTFSAEPGQEIDAEIYEEMFNCVPPYRLPRVAVTETYKKYSVYMNAGFLMGEPATCDRNGASLYMAFGRNDDHYYYLGLYKRGR